MKNLFIKILILVLFLAPSASFAMTIKGGVEKVWTVALARKEAFKDARSWVDVSHYPAIDKNFNTNKDLIDRKQFDGIGRHIVLFSDGSYSVRYYNTIAEVYSYNSSGRLEDIEFTLYPANIYTRQDLDNYQDMISYPLKTYKHSYPDGKIMAVILGVSNTEAFAFLPNRELIQHCIDDKCYDASNNLIYTRESE